jgi:hypothetical protein
MSDFERRLTDAAEGDLNFSAEKFEYLPVQFERRPEEFKSHHEQFERRPKQFDE